MSSTPFSARGDVLRLRSSLLLILLSLLLFSCSERKAMALVSDEGASVYAKNGGTLSEISVDEPSLSYLEDISGMSAEEVISDLFSVEADYISSDLWNKRCRMISLLERESLSEDYVEALGKYGKDLRKTDFINTINELSSDFDDEELLDWVIDASHHSRYSLAPVLSYNIRDYGEVKAFISLWMEEIMR